MAIKDWSATAASNTAISGINIAEGCPPSGINDAIRQLMADVKAADFGTAAPKMDTIAESTSGAGVTIDGLIIKDGTITGLAAVKVSSNDTTPGDLETKVLAGTGIAMSTQNDGADETRTLAVDVGTTANKIVQLDANAKLPAVDGSQLTNMPASTDPVARDQIALLNMRLLLNSGVSSGALIQGRMWELLTDEWGATSTNEAYVSGALGYYSNQSRSTTASAATGWTSYPSFVTFTSGGISISATNSTVAYQYPSAVLVGDFDLSYTLGASSASYDNSIQFGVSTDALTTTSTGLQGAANTFNSWWFSHSGIGTGKTITLWHQQTSLATVTGVTIAAGNVFTIRRSGSALTLLHNGTQIATFTGFSSTANLYICGGDYYGSYTLTSVAYTVTGSLTTATLINPTFTISASGYLDAYFLYLDETGGAVAGTDFTVELSGNGGTNYYTATLTTPLGAAGYDGTYTLYKARAAIAVTGTSPKARIVLNNTKVQRVAAPSIYAE